MAQKKPTIQITCSAELKADIEDLSASFRQATSDFLRPLNEEIVELNREQITRYREVTNELANSKLIRPTAPMTDDKGANKHEED